MTREEMIESLETEAHQALRSAATGSPPSAEDHDRGRRLQVAAHLEVLARAVRAGAVSALSTKWDGGDRIESATTLRAPVERIVLTVKYGDGVAIEPA